MQEDWEGKINLIQCKFLCNKLQRRWPCLIDAFNGWINYRSS